MGTRVTVCSVLLFFVLASSRIASAQTLTSTYYLEACYWGACDSRLSYYASGEPTLQGIADLFGVGFNDLMGANNLDIRKATSLASSRVPNGTVVLIPMRCDCYSQVRRTNQTVYTVKPGDSLSKISDEIFGRLTVFQEIAKVNNIANPDLIEAGAQLTIPFACSCPNATAPNPSIHLTYQVASGDSFDIIAKKFDSNAKTIQTLNNVTNASSLLIDQLLRVPIPACLANFSGGAQDKNLMVANGAYNLTTPEDCVQCKCYGSPTPSMHCVPNPARNNSLCPSLDCSQNLQIGNFTTRILADGQCEVTSCEYAGYDYPGKVEKPITQTVAPTCPAYPSVPPPNDLGTIPGSTSPSAPSSPGAPGGPPANSSALILSGSQPLLFSAASVFASLLLFR